MSTLGALNSVIGPLQQRSSPRQPDFAAENAVLISLVDALARSPQDIFQRLAEAALEITGAQSAGISLFDPSGRQFVWPAVAGAWAGHVGGTMPRDFSPCGTVLDRDQALLFRRPERHFAYVAEISPRIEEGLLVPFHIENQPMGTIWAIHHDAEHFFDAEDERLLTSLSKITAAAHRTLTDIGVLTHLE